MSDTNMCSFIKENRWKIWVFISHHCFPSTSFFCYCFIRYFYNCTFVVHSFRTIFWLFEWCSYFFYGIKFFLIVFFILPFLHRLSKWDKELRFILTCFGDLALFIFVFSCSFPLECTEFLLTFHSKCKCWWVQE